MKKGTRMTKKSDDERVEVTAAVAITSSPYGAHEKGESFFVPADKVDELEQAGFITRGKGNGGKPDAQAD